MSKRGAEEYITKEHGSTPNAAEEGIKVKMATAAQMAKRKMAVPKSRGVRTGQSPLPGAPPSNPFAGTNTFGASQTTQPPTQTSSGFAFGASQSFPSGDSTSNNAFSFSLPGQSSSFTFGQPAPNNPFANLNGSTNDQSSQSPETNDITMESPQKKPAFGSNTFGSSNVNTTQSTGFSFGQATSQPSGQSTFAFGQPQGFGSVPSTSLFGQSPAKPQEPSPSPTLFGQTPQPKGSTPNGSAPSDQRPGSAQDTPVTSATQGFSFGQPTTTAPSSAPAFSFGQSVTSAPSPSAFSFGKPSEQPTTNGTTLSGSKPVSQPGFGTSTPAAAPATSTPLFGSSSTSTTNNLFGGFGGSKPVEPMKSTEMSSVPEPAKSTPFGQRAGSPTKDQPAPSSTTQDTPKVNPFAGLFSQSGAKTSGPSATPASDTPKPLFNFAAPAQPSGLFSLPKSTGGETSSEGAGDATKKSLFNFGTPASKPASTMFSPATPSNPFAGLPTDNTQQSGQKSEESLFGLGKGPEKQPASASETGFKPTSAFGQTPSSKTSLPSDSSTPKAFSGFGNSSSSGSQAVSQQSSSDVVPQSKTPSAPAFGKSSASSTMDPSRSRSELFGTSSTVQPSDMDITPSDTTASSSYDGPRRNINTHPPTRIPPYLNGDEYKSYDSNYRLHSLNREFQKRIASIDPSREDFENIIRNYVAARESIGESIGLYTRNVAGMKRKADGQDDGYADDINSAKRTKSAMESPSKALFGNSQTPNAAFQPVPSSTPKPPVTSTNTETSQVTNTATSSASSLFSSMIPDKSASSTSAPANPFANLPKTNATQSETPSKPTFSFGNSTTPTKSPPKKSSFELPKFAAPATSSNFMDAFKKQSEASIAKFEKEAKAKRKAEEFDSDEDDEEEWERKYEEEEKAKKAKVGGVAQQGFKPSFGGSTSTAPASKPAFNFGSSAPPSTAPAKAAAGFLFGQQNTVKPSEKPIEISDNDASGEDGDEEGSRVSGNTDNDEEDEEDEEEAEDDDDDLPEDEVEDDDNNEEDDDFETVMAKSRSQGKSLFDRVAPNPNSQKQAQPAQPASALTPSIEKDPVTKPPVFGNLFGKSTPEAPAFSPLTPSGSKEPYVPSKTFNFTSTPPVTSPTPTSGASIFAGGLVKDGPIVGEGLFGSRPSTPSNADKPKSNVFGNLGTPSFTSTSDNTWKKGSEIKFGASTTEAPAISITGPSPRKEEPKTFANLFGATSTSTTNPSSAAGIGFNFGQNSAPGFLSSTSHLAGGSGTPSGMSSRATSPGTTDNESVATNEEDFSNDTQVSLMDARPGEENETVIFETRARALRWYTEEQIVGTKMIKGWNAVGLGIARLLKHRTTGKVRLVMRAEPGANVILNANLQPEVHYEFVPSGSAGTVKFNVFTNEGVQGWTLKVKTQKQGQDLAKMMENNKKAST